MTVAENKVVSINYQVKDASGEVLDASAEGTPLEYLHGHGNLIPGLENALTGMEAGTEFEVVVEPKDGYGEIHAEMVQEVPKEAFQQTEEIVVGMAFTAETNQGPVRVVVTNVSDDTVTVDGNHPLAGKTLTFTGSVAAVREPKDDELEHGHVHGPSCNH
ncbi:peptidylprolyl isomerase [Corallincola luteus]|uniref:Peptidyl-prolyl cis-trans isomerase n=2 Tax=Corallincola TaxID=1775176 RepID=A0A368NQP3_9GAMM|nr:MULTISPECIES: peptidylprolyl isomerase [Corallincola]RCU52887.1 peptidylprolyl isomerase [Corallincola holothuriorum]TCI03384.1 peptidylprolyl isomerase [Corallincola luteus]